MESADSFPLPDGFEVRPPPLPPPLPFLGNPQLTWKRLTRNATLDLLAVFFLTFVFVVVDMVVRGSFRRGLAPGKVPTALIVDVFVAQEACLLLVALRRWRQYRQQGFTTPRLFEGNVPRAIAQGMLAGIALVIVGVLWVFFMQRVFHFTVPNRFEFLGDLTGHPVIIGILVFIGAIVAPVCEEFFFRAVIFGCADSAGARRAGWIVSALLFAAAHLTPSMSPYYILFGATTCWVMLRTRTIAGAMAAHITVNSTACLGMLASHWAGR